MTVRYCPKCSAETVVVDSRVDYYGRVRRRRKCPVCGYRFNTVEVEVSEIQKPQDRESV